MFPPEPVIIDTSEALDIQHFDDMWIVEGPWLQRLVATINFEGLRKPHVF